MLVVEASHSTRLGYEDDEYDGESFFLYTEASLFSTVPFY